MKYLSFFSGIGCFEHAIQQVYPGAECIGFSEIDPFAIQVYTHHFPNHSNLGDITKVTETHIRRLLRAQRTCDLIVGGFPCQDLSSFANFSDAQGLNGKRSGLFFSFVRVISWIFQYSAKTPKIIIENNASMSKTNRTRITQVLQEIHPRIEGYMIDSTSLGMLQRRRRLFWTNFTVPEPKRPKRLQTWKDVLLPEPHTRDLFATRDRISGYNTLYRTGNSTNRPVIARQGRNGWYTFVQKREKQLISRWTIVLPSFPDTRETFASSILCTPNQLLIVRNHEDSEQFKLRQFHSVELERLFGLPDGYVSDICSRSRSKQLLGNAIVVPVLVYILRNLTTK